VDSLFFVCVCTLFRSPKMESATVSSSSTAGPANWCVFGWLLGLAQLLLHGALGLVLFWAIYYREGFGWRDQPKQEFNYHPVLMIGGFVYLVGNGQSTYTLHINKPITYLKCQFNCFAIQLCSLTARTDVAVKSTRNSSIRCSTF